MYLGPNQGHPGRLNSGSTICWADGALSEPSNALDSNPAAGPGPLGQCHTQLHGEAPGAGYDLLVAHDGMSLSSMFLFWSGQGKAPAWSRALEWASSGMVARGRMGHTRVSACATHVLQGPLGIGS